MLDVVIGLQLLFKPEGKNPGNTVLGKSDLICPPYPHPLTSLHSLSKMLHQVRATLGGKIP